MLTLLLISLAVVEDRPPTRWTGGASFSATVPFAAGDNVTGALDAGFEPVAQLRISFIATMLNRLHDFRAPAAAHGFMPRFMLGIEGIITPLLPVEVAGGPAVGLALIGKGNIDGSLGLTVQFRGFIGYRFLRWLTAGLLVSANAMMAPASGPYWIEIGARTAFRW